MAGWAGFWGNAADSHSLLTNRNPLETAMGKLLRRPSMKKLAVAMKALNGAAAGGATTASVKRVDHNDGVKAVGSMGGLVEINSATVISGTSTSTQETRIDAIIDFDTKPTYVRDLSGNGSRG